MTNRDIPPQPEIVENKIEKLKKRRSDLLQKMTPDERLQFWDQVATDYGKDVEEAYNAEHESEGKTFRQHKAFHELIGSTTDNKKSPYDDFLEPEYSVEKFIERKEKEYGVK